MRNLQVQRAFKINATFTANQWQLYASSMDCTDAANMLNKTLNDAVNAGHDRKDVMSAMHNVMNKYINYGACDSEPIWFLEDVLDKIFGE